MQKVSTVHQRVLAAAVALTLFVPAFGEAQTKVKPGFNLFSPQQDVEIGQRSAAEVESQLPMVTDDAVESYIDGIGQRLAAHAPGPKFRYRFRVVNASDLNAFALPGGYLYINRGAIEAAKNEGEIAGVLAHEIAHSALRHGTHNASKAYATQAGLSILGGILGGKVGAGTAQIINAVGGFGLNAVFLKYSRDAERQADIAGTQMLARAGYNPADMVSFFQTLQRTDKRKTVRWLSSHPQTGDRIKAIQREAQAMGVALRPTTKTAALDSVQARLQRMSPARTTEELARMRTAGGSTPSSRSRGGYSPSRVEPPSSQMRTYTNQSRVFQLQYPANWQVVAEGRNGVTVAPPGGAGEINGNAEVVYGAIVSHFEPDEEGGLGGYDRPNIEDATNELIGVIQRASPHLRVVSGSGQRVRMSGGTGLAVTLRGKSRNTGINERVTVVTRQLEDGHLVYMLFITPEGDAAAYRETLSAMVNSLRVDPDQRH